MAGLGSGPRHDDPPLADDPVKRQAHAYNRRDLDAYSYLLAGLLPRAQLKIYPDSAHGFLFQHHAEFAADVRSFLTAAH